MEDVLKLSNIDLILDTNVCVSFISCVDLWEAYKKFVINDKDKEKWHHQREMAKYSLKLCLYLNKKSCKTIALAGEGSRVLRKQADPSANSIETYHITHFLYFIKDYILPLWKDEALLEDKEPLLSGNKIDDFIMNLAYNNNIPIISNEGYSYDGIDNSNRMRKKCKERNIDIFTPKEFLENKKFSGKKEILKFIQSIEKSIPSYVAKHMKLHNLQKPDKLAPFLADMLSFYRHLLID